MLTASLTNPHADVAHRFRGHLATMVNSLAVIRLTKPAVAADPSFHRAERELIALRELVVEIENAGHEVDFGTQPALSFLARDEGNDPQL